MGQPIDETGKRRQERGNVNLNNALMSKLFCVFVYLCVDRKRVTLNAGPHNSDIAGLLWPRVALASKIILSLLRKV